MQRIYCVHYDEDINYILHRQQENIVVSHFVILMQEISFSPSA
jgi:hypothetical protein